MPMLPITHLGLTPAFPLTVYIDLGKQLHLLDPHFPNWKMDIIIAPNWEGCLIMKHDQAKC